MDHLSGSVPDIAVEDLQKLLNENNRESILGHHVSSNQFEKIISEIRVVIFLTA